MATDGSPIDISILEALIELRKQQAQVDQFCQRAEERKDKVEAAVFSRVMADYGKRRADLEAQAAPLVTKALVEYRKLRASFDAVRATQAAARLDKEEVEFRHALGEVDDPVKVERLIEPERLIAETTEQLAGLDKHEALFGQALPGVDLEAALQAAPDPEPPAPEPPAPEPPPPPAAVSGSRAAATSGAKRAASAASKAASGTAKAASDSGTHALPPDDPQTSGTVEVAALRPPMEEAVEFADTDQTMLEVVGPASADFVWPPVDDGLVSVPIANSGAFAVGKPPTPPPTPEPPSRDVDVEDRTFIVAEALLLSEADNGQAVNFRLTALTYIGRSEDNQLRLLDPGVSRRHVLVMATPGGYTIRDLGSQNGTYVNGARVDESPLTDGDRITIGEINLVFRGAPAAVSA
ncbi:MAG: FHA domain-containing protein [Vicinamibacteraceae bacterium]